MSSRAASTPLNMVLSVLLTCVAAAAALAFTYGATHELILAQEKAAEERALLAALPGASSFEALDADLLERADAAAGETPVSGVWVASAETGQIGWTIRCGPRGYGGPIQLVVGLDRNGKVAGVSIVTHNETPGLGSSVLEDPVFMGQFEAWDGADIDRSAKAFDAVSGATKSSVGVRAGVLAAGYVYRDVLSGQSGGSDSE